MLQPGRIELGPLRERNFRNLWIGRTASVVGDSLAFVALAFAVLAVNGSGTDLGLVIMSYSAPSVIFLLVGGVWADRLPRRAVMLGADVVRALAQLVLAIAVLSGNAPIPLFMLVALVSGIATAFFQPASIGLVPQVVSQERLQQGNAMLNLSQSVSQLFGPVLSGILVIAIGSGWVFAIDAISFAVSAAALWSLRMNLPPREAHGSFAGDLAAGWREVRKQRWLPPSLLAFAFVNLSFASFMVLGPATMQAEYGGAADWGLILAAFGLGGLIGGAAALRWKPSRPLIAVFVLMALNAVRLTVLAFGPPLAAILVFVTVAAAATTLGDTIWHTTVQTNVPARSLSRVSSYDWMVSLLFFPVGAAVAGPLAEAVGTSTALFIFAAISSIPSILVLLLPAVRSITRRDGPVDDETPAEAGALGAHEREASLQPAA